MKDDCCLGHFDEVQRIDDPVAASGAHSVNGLRILQIRIHARRRLDEPRAKMRSRVCGKISALREHPCSGKRRRLNAQPNQQQAMGVEVGRIGFAVAIDVGAIGISSDQARNSRPQKNSRVDPPALREAGVETMVSGCSCKYRSAALRTRARSIVSTPSRGWLRISSASPCVRSQRRDERLRPTRGIRGERMGASMILLASRLASFHFPAICESSDPASRNAPTP